LEEISNNISNELDPIIAYINKKLNSSKSIRVEKVNKILYEICRH